MTLNEKITAALSYVRMQDIQTLPAGKYPINDYSYFMVQEYTTKPVEECRVESHRRYIDIQWMIRGTEKIACADISRLTEKTDYNAEKDIMFWQHADGMLDIVLTPGAYTVLYPEHGHMPCICADEPAAVRKIVIKVAI